MDTRKRTILQALTEDYINSAEPVGSRTLAKKYNLGISPATIRNEMADLEEWGFLEQPHTSAGRVPSDKGYRFYVDELMSKAPIGHELLERIRSTYQSRVRELEWFIHQTAKLVSDITGYPSIVLAPSWEQGIFSALHFVGVGEDSALLIIRTADGFTQNKTVSIPKELSLAQLNALAQDFSRQFAGVSMRDLQNYILDPLSTSLFEHAALWQTVLGWFLTEGSDDERMTVAGPLTILNYPEFNDINKVRRVLGFLEQDKAVEQIVHSHPADGVMALIGSETSIEDIQDCSVVTASYRVGQTVVGRVMVVGPRRMQYAYVMTVLEVVSDELSQALKWA
ncbi:heat-inducible transcriptional repressor HrcA [Sulfobacillus thermosulfidooxidans]|uniref:Heat-inducible transcription repressor HrcA n=2 Tax=Sulfobacillus thermosulfidooxidans TaxID=28034 RepID=A0A1W1W8B1_SULTA|nr:heat-inducible transcriptional repressor HrcA [Sulfobacillus thermosulfidooxidans]OLZ10460.1 heat-inducible transcription repressor HrcA [Sulfobacillus thermosulfidooxidans]OLZ14284.1 heat-inducible transcription repressor HrcA [Sulfobacillus thermosulfidooxidans]OLZ19027.1 heat-inducible transcription repressor HrcA [Sulfobacillus thermosulfidooxidans]PSR28597.1 MAG: heat-inducible transcription repressor HrcA [Sulfobacillus thermosulfidooxidans]SMC02531.1 heat-inducible transcription repr